MCSGHYIQFDLHLCFNMLNFEYRHLIKHTGSCTSPSILYLNRDSDVKILAILDDVQALLDDHILKSQSMRGSPFIAALGKKATDWEEKLINMQDIMDVWVQVQSTWMYLEPIFSSEDIMRQMPVEGRNFKAVIVYLANCDHAAPKRSIQ